MTMRQLANGLLTGAVLLLVGCGHEEVQRAAAAPSGTGTSTTSKESTPEERASKSATEVVDKMLRVTDAAKQDPGVRDWEPEIRRYAGDPAAFLAVQAVRDYAALGLRQQGNTAVDLAVAGVDLTAAEGPTVRIRGCYDAQSTKVVKVQTGEVVPPGTPQRFVWDITVTRYQNEPASPWLVNMLDPHPDQPC